MRLSLLLIRFCYMELYASTEREETALKLWFVKNFKRDQDPVPGTSTDGPGPDGTGARPALCCEKCQLAQNWGFERVTPRRISHGRLLALLDGEGTYECSVTGLVFEVTQKAEVCYSVLSWSKYGAYLKDFWKFAGPIFNVDCEPSILTSIQFPHSLCLAGQDGEVTFSVLHVKNGRGLVEPSAGHSGNHVTWRVTSLSPVGPIVRTSQPTVYHGVVLVYRKGEPQASSSFHVYMAANNHSEIEDIRNEVREKRFVQIYKPPSCKLEEQKMYQLNSEPEGEITPENLEFTSEVLKLKKYFEVFLEKPPPFRLKLSLVETELRQAVWSATLREGDFVDNANEKPRKRTKTGPKSSSSTSEEVVLISKRARHGDVPADKELFHVRKYFVVGVSEAVIKQLLDGLLQDGFINAGEKDAVIEENKSREDKARCLIDTVQRKGPDASEKLISSLRELDPNLFELLF